MVSIHDYRSYTLKSILRLIIAEFLLFIFAFGLGIISTDEGWYVLYYLKQDYYSNYIFNIITIAATFSGLFITSMHLFGLYKKYMNLNLQEQFLRGFAASASLLFVLNNLSYWFQFFDIGKYVWLVSVFIGLIFIFITRTIFNVLTKTNKVKTKTVILGTGNNALQLKNNMDEMAEVQTEIIGYIYKPGDRERLPREQIIDLSLHAHCSDTVLLNYCLKNDINTIVVAVDDRRNNFPLAQLLSCKQHGINVIELMEFYEHELGREQLNILDPSWIIFTNKIHQSKQYELNKRALDITLALILFILCLPLSLIISFALKLNNGLTNKLIKRTEVIGKLCKTICLYEFNCTNKKGEATFIGKLVTNLKLQHLPILLNVVKGDLSFIGPQVIKKDIDEPLKVSLWYYRQRYSAKPGLISWGYNYINYDDVNDKINTVKYQLQYDLFYVKKKTMLFDLLLLLYKIFNMDLIITGTKLEPNPYTDNSYIKN